MLAARTKHLGTIIEDHPERPLIVALARDDHRLLVASIALGILAQGLEHPAEIAEGVRRCAAVAFPSRDRRGLEQERLAVRDVAQERGRAASAEESGRAARHVGRDGCEQVGEPTAPLGQVSADVPEPEQPACHPQGALGRVPRQVVEGGTQVVVLGFEPIPPPSLVGTEQVRGSFVREREEVLGVPISRGAGDSVRGCALAANARIVSSIQKRGSPSASSRRASRLLSPSDIRPSTASCPEPLKIDSAQSIRTPPMNGDSHSSRVRSAGSSSW